MRSRRYAYYVVGLLTVINFFNYVDRLVLVTMYDDLRAKFAFSDAQIGSFLAAFFVVHAVATLPLGWAADHFDRRKIIGLGVIIWSLATFLSAYAWGFVSMLVLRGAVGVGEAAYGPSANAILCETFPDKKARVVGIFNGGMFAGACVGLAAGGILGFPTAFEVVAVPGLALGFLALVLDIPAQRKRPVARPHFGVMLRDGWRTLRAPTLRWMLVSGVLISFAAGGYTAWIVDFTTRYKGLTKQQAIPIYFVITATAGVLGVVGGGVIGDWLQRRNLAGRTRTIAMGFLASVPFAVGVVVFDHGVPYFTCGWLLFFFIAFYNGPMAATIDDVVDDADASTAQATFVFFLHTLGTGPSSFVLGFLSDRWTLRGAFLLPAAAVLGAGLAALQASRHVAGDIRARDLRARPLGVASA
jgi:predicted MFS family arabinose efflux permease